MTQTLLLADDSVTIQRVIELTFADEDIRVIAVSDGDQAIAALDHTPPDIVLADVGMPGRDGYEVAAHVKHTPRLAHIPVLLLTGAFEPIDRTRAADAGCDGVLAKPFEPQLVISRVKELLARPREIPPLDQTIASLPAAPPAWSSASEAGLSDQGAHAASRPPADDVDEYFDRLDRAFANLNAPKPEPSGAPRTVVDEVDWFSTSAPVASAPQPVAVEGAAGQPPTAAVSESPAVAPPAAHADAVAQPAAPAFPPLADAFAALLAAEQSVAPPPHGPWPPARTDAAPNAAEPKITDEAIEECARRVLDRLTDGVVRETVSGIVSQVAERLVREEIDRIKRGQ